MGGLDYSDEYLEPPVSLIIPDRLWLGQIDDALDETTLTANQIKTIINLSHKQGNISPTYKNLWTPLNDGWGNEPWEFSLAVEALANSMTNGERVLIHCLAGMSRSPCVVATYLAKERGISFDEALLVVQNLRPIAMPCEALVIMARKYLGEV